MKANFDTSPARRIGSALGLTVLLGLALPAHAQSRDKPAAAPVNTGSDAQAIYKCDSEGGVPTYQNAPGKNCRRLELAPLTTFNAPQVPRAAAQSQQRANREQTAAAGNFPRVDSPTQRARDSDRRRIIDDELKREESRLDVLRKEYNNGEPERRAGERNFQLYLDRVQQMKEEIERSEANLASLRRELASIRD